MRCAAPTGIESLCVIGHRRTTRAALQGRRSRGGGLAIRSVFTTALVLLACISAARAAEPEIGMIKTLSGHGWVVTGAQRVAAAIGGKVHQNDSLETEMDGALGVTFLDNTTLSLGPQSQIELGTFIFDPNGNRYGFVTRVAHGTFLFVTGMIGKLAPQSVSVETPTGSIGIRGTRFLVKVEK